MSHSSSPRWTTARSREALHRDAVALLATDFGPDVTIDTVASAISTSRRQLQRAFEEVAGTTFSAHLSALRMERALVLLATSSRTIADVALQVGYRDPSQFRRTFKRRYGVTPSNIRVLAERPSGAGARIDTTALRAGPRRAHC
ncbi:MAG TPA: helix-turn-helix transcriptional regulator [Solirubrobacteraceae bacterium]|nr:helix-turn-helix transcriptional regulator [Solirubrobacteraceae bacterium]